MKVENKKLWLRIPTAVKQLKNDQNVRNYATSSQLRGNSLPPEVF